MAREQLSVASGWWSVKRRRGNCRRKKRRTKPIWNRRKIMIHMGLKQETPSRRRPNEANPRRVARWSTARADTIPFAPFIIRRSRRWELSPQCGKGHPFSGIRSERLHSGRGGVAESKIQPLLRDQCLAGQFGPLRQNVRAIPRAVLAWLAAHGFQPDLVCKSHWTAGKVGVRAHGAWDHEMFARDLGWSVFQCFAVPLVAFKSVMAVRADRLDDGHKSFIPKGLDCVP